MNEVEKVPAISPGPLVAIIEKAVMNPDIDVGKMQQLLDMQLIVMDREARQAYIRDFAMMQSEFPIIRKRGKTQQSTYATFDDINDGTAPARGKYGFALSFVPETTEGIMRITATMSHYQGHTETSAMSLPFDTSGAKNAVQAIGSALKYGMRYGIVAPLSLSTHDEGDDDAESLHKMVTAAEAASLQARVEKYGLNELKILAYYSKVFSRNLANFDDFPAGCFDRVMKEVDKQAAKQSDLPE